MSEPNNKLNVMGMQKMLVSGSSCMFCRQRFFGRNNCAQCSLRKYSTRCTGCTVHVSGAGCRLTLNHLEEECGVWGLGFREALAGLGLYYAPYMPKMVLLKQRRLHDGAPKPAVPGSKCPFCIYLVPKYLHSNPLNSTI